MEKPGRSADPTCSAPGRQADRPVQERAQP